MNPLPRLSVIIATRAAPPVLEQTLASLARQTLPAAEYEILIVSGAAPEEALRRVPAGFPAALRVLHQPGDTAGVRRNAGAAAARGALLVFLDDDMQASPGFLEAHTLAHQNADPRSVVIGSLNSVFHPRAGGGALAWHALDLRDWWEDAFAEMAQPGHRFAFTDLFAGNFSLPAVLFAQAGGFDPTYPCRDDFELGYRLLQAGARFKFCPAARSLHLDATTFPRSLERKRAEGQVDMQLARRYPELAPELPFTPQVDGQARPVRALREIIRRWPGLGRALQRLGLTLAAIAEAFDLRGLWRQASAGLLTVAYWDGIFRETRNWAEIRELAGGPPTSPLPALDLSRGIQAAEAALEQGCFTGTRLTWHGYPLGCIPARAGAEPLRAEHLRAWLAGPGALPTARAQAAFAALGVEDDEAFDFASYTAPEAGDWVDFDAQLKNHKPASLLMPAVVTDLDLADGLPALQAAISRAQPALPLRVLLRRHGAPVAWVHLTGAAAPHRPEELIHAILTQACHAALLGAPPAPLSNPTADISVVVCTRGRVDMLHNCLRALQNQSMPAREIIVVDNAPLDDRARRLAGELGVRYRTEERPGLDFARNRGAQAATGSIVAYVDDDACPAADWIAALARAFDNPDSMAVTGFVAPAELDTPAQCLFEWEYGGMGHGFVSHLHRRDLMEQAGLLWASGFGVGTNMAFRRAVLLQSGGFDPALDVGGPAGGGGDVEMFHRLVAAGHALRYEPAALVWHTHRRDLAALRRQLFNNGRSFGAYLLTCAARRSVPLGSIAAFALFDWAGGWLLRRLLIPGKLPRSLVLAEILGAILSPLAYWRAHRRVKNMS